MKTYNSLLIQKVKAFTYLIFLSLLLFACNTKNTKISLLEEPKHLNDSTYVKHYAYSLSYNEDTEQPNWVAYELNVLELTSKFKRIDNFIPDSFVVTGTATNEDYKHCGYDRGHLAPAADMVWNEQAMRESFYYSNISPQLPAFNRGIWKVLETKVRAFANTYCNLYITCGPLFINSDSSIGNNEVMIPTHFYKTVLVYNSDVRQCIGFLFPHEKCNGELFDYAVSVDSIERLINLDLYHKLPDWIELDIESEFNSLEWQ
jgi:endonuclease G